LYELVPTGSEQTQWFPLGPDEAKALGGLIGELDPHLEVLEFADLCALVRAVTGTPPTP
jgi:hypothetical protein